MPSPSVLISTLALAAAISPVQWLQGYIQLDTRNPPGNEVVGAEYLSSILEHHSIPSRLLTSPSGRTSLYSRLPATEQPIDGSAAGTLVLLHHIDVVDSPGPWQAPPFSAKLEDQRIWGRGAIDVKSLGIAHIATMIEAMHGFPNRTRDLVLLATADEERGGHEGVGWLLEEHPELFENVEAVLNEGGSNRANGDRLLWWGIEVVQKRPLWLRIQAEGRGGHASGLNTTSAMHQLVLGLASVVERPPRFRVSPAARMYFESIDTVTGGDFHTQLDDVFAREDPMDSLPVGLPTFFLDSLQITSIDTGSGGGNVVSPRAVAYVDIRLLPDTDQDRFVADLRDSLASDLSIEIELSAPEVEISPRDHPVYSALERTLRIRAPVVATFISGATDSRYFRERGIPAYGFSPFTMNSSEIRGIHGVDESIPVDDFVRGVETMIRVVRSYVTRADSNRDN